MSSFRQTWLWPWLLSSVPAIGWLVYALAAGFALEGDNAQIAVRTFDVFSSNPPILGMPSTAGNEVSGVNAFHPGPLQFWLLAPFYALSGGHAWGILVGSLVINLGLTGLGLWAAWQINSVRVNRAVATAFALTLFALQFVWFTPWNPFPVVVGSAALIALSWGILLGIRGWLPLAVFVGSLVAQAHLAGVLIVGPLLLVVLVYSRRLGWAAKPGYKEVVISVMVLLACWSGPMWDLAMQWPGNVGAVLDYAAGVSNSAQVTGKSRMPDVASLIFGVVLGVLSVRGLRIVWTYLKVGSLGTQPTEENIIATGLLLTSVVTVICSAGYFLAGSSRGMYFAMFSTIWIIHLLLLKSRSRAWWESGARTCVNVTIMMAIGFLFFALVGNARMEDQTASRTVVEATRELSSGLEDENFLIHMRGPHVEMSIGGAVVAELLTSNHNVYYSHFGNRADYDAQRRSENAPDSRVELYVIQQNDDLTWPETSNGRELYRREVDVPHWDIRVRLILIDER